MGAFDKDIRVKRNLGFTILIGFSILLLIFLLVGQSFALINYDWAVSIGLQESEKEVTLLGIAWLKSFAIADTVAYIPLLIAGIIGLIQREKWGFYTLFGSLAISVYWPIVNLSAIYIGKNEIALNSDKYISFSILLPIIVIYGVLGMWYLYNNQNTLIK